MRVVEASFATFLSSGLFWAIAAVAVAAIAIVVAVILARRAREAKVLAYETSTTALLHERARSAGLEVSLYGQPVRDVHLVELRIGNAGNAPVRSEDFETPLRVQVAQGEPLDAEITATIPDDLSPEIPPWVAKSNAIEVEPLLLNPGDGFTVQMVVSEFAGPVTLGGRIAGATFVSATVSRQDQLVETIFEAAKVGIGITVPGADVMTGAIERLHRR